MTITPKVWDFPALPISKQVFHVPGMAYEGGFTSGGARIVSPQPGGFGMLEVQPSWHFDEYANPHQSWLMSKTNGEILRIRLATTPQVSIGDNSAGLFAQAALEGASQVVIDLNGVSNGHFLRAGHVIGHAYDCYMINEIIYQGPGEPNVGIAQITPPLRRAVAFHAPALTRPWFTGYIINGSEFIQTFDAINNGGIQIGKIVLAEAII